jgi:twitching motility protein PilT
MLTSLEFDQILEVLLRSNDGISDILFTVNRPLQVEAFGVLKPVYFEPEIHSLTPFQVEQVALTLIGNQPRLLHDLHISGSCDTSYALGPNTRFRVNVFRQRGHFAVVMRKLESAIPTIDSLGLPPIFKSVAREKNGLVLFTGATGSGKTTSMAAILEEINETQAVHIVTLEDPIEYSHDNQLATFNQRELGLDFTSYPVGLRAALRQAPKVILVGEMRDRETVEIVLRSAETGHLVFSTLHTIDAGQAIGRILGMFSPSEEKHIRIRLADTLRYIVSQRLVPRVGGGRHLLTEIMGNNLRTREAVELGEGENRTFYEIIEASATYGWTTFDMSILKAFQEGKITEETALMYASHKGRVMRDIDTYKKTHGGAFEAGSGLKLDIASTTRGTV